MIGICWLGAILGLLIGIYGISIGLQNVRFTRTVFGV